MKQSTIKDLRTTSIVLLIAILSSASAFYILPNVGTSVHAGVYNPNSAAFKVSYTAMNSTAGFLNATNVNGNGLRAMGFYTFTKANLVPVLKIQITDVQCKTFLLPNGSKCTIVVTRTSMIIIYLIKLTTSIRVWELDDKGFYYYQDFNLPSGTPQFTPPRVLETSPGSGQLLIHEYTSTDLEMQAFQAGSIDMVDWDIPQAYLSAWNNCASATPIGPNCNGQITTSKYSATDLYEMDLNENGSRVASQLSFRQAMGYLVDRQNIVLNIAGGFAQPVCSGASAGQEGSASCQSLGYPGPYGDYNPTKALQLLYEDGWRYNPADGFLYGPALPGALGQAACSSTITGQTGNFCVRPIIFMIRSDDPLRLGAGQAMANIMQNLPNQFCSKAGGNINPIPPCPAGSTLTTVCPTAPCKLSTSLNVAAKPALAKIFQHHPWNTWDIYTGGWGLDILVANDLPFLWTSDFAPAPDCGLWQGDFPLNYGGFCNTAFDNAAHAVLNAPTISQADAAAVAAQQVAWGYSSSQGKITGAMPMVPMYSHLAYKAAWTKDVGAGLCANGSAVGSSGCPNPTYAQRACWQNFIGNEVGVGLNIYQTLISWYDDNCAGNTAGHVSYVNNPNTVFDWGFINPIEFLNIMQSTFLWDIQAMAQTYDTMMGRNAANPSELIPFLCSDYAVGTYFNTHTSASATYYACHMRSDLFWSDGVPLTAQDIAFSTDYIAENQAPLTASNVANLCGPNFVAGTPFYSPTNCGNGVQIVNNPDGSQTILFYFDSISAIFPLLVGLFNPIIPKHVYCNDWTGPAAGKLGPGAKATGNCLFPDMSQLPDKAGLSDGSCTDCPAFPGTYPNATAVPIPSYLSSIGYGSTIKNWQTGSGPYMISSCGGSGCANTILLKENPYWHDGTRMASPGTGDIADPSGLHGGLELQPDLNRDGVVNSKDLTIAQDNFPGNGTEWRASVAFRQGTTGSETITVPSSVCGTGCTTPAIGASFTGWPGTSTDVYIIQKLIQEGKRLGLCVAVGSDPCGQGGITWPPASGSVTNKNGYLPSGAVGRLTYIWPDSSGTSGVPDDTVNVNDLIYVNNHQFVPVTDSSGNLIPTSPYNADITHDGLIDIHDLVTTLTRQFSSPAGVNP